MIGHAFIFNCRKEGNYEHSGDRNANTVTVLICLLAIDLP